MTHARILLADDSRSVRESVLGMLSELTDVSITPVENGAQALKEACTGNYALLVCDIEMPIMNGIQLLRVIRSQFFSGSELPIIMLTQLEQAEQKVRAFADGANDYVTKPVEPQELIARVRAQLALRTQHRENLANQAFSLHAQKLAAVAQLSATLAHELNTPAQYLGDNVAFLHQAFRDFDTWLKRNGADDLPAELAYLRQELPQCLQDMREGIERVTKIVQTMSEFAEPSSQRIKVVDLTHCINTVVDLLRSRWLGMVDLTTQHSTQIRTVRCGPTDLKHALWQLIALAVDDASAPGEAKGQADITTRLDDEHAFVNVRAIRRVPRPPDLETTPPGLSVYDDALRLTRDVLLRHHGELTRHVDPDGSTTSVIKLAT